MNMTGSNHKTAAAWNRGLTIRLLRRHGTLSRNDISQMTQLQGSTLSYIMRELLDKGVVRVVGKRKSNQVGQKQVLLTLNPELGWTLGVSLRPGVATMMLLDAAGERIDGIQTPIQGALETMPKQINTALVRWLKRRGAPLGKMLGVGVAVPGVVDAEAGVVLRSSPLQAVNVPLRQMIEEEFDVTSVVDHDACFGATAEATDGTATEAGHFLFFSINLMTQAGKTNLSSYGSALYLQGKIYRGAFFAAGELSDPLVPADTDLSESDMATLADADSTLSATLSDLANRMGTALAPIVNLVDVQMVVLAGTARIANRRFIDAVQAAVTERLVPIPGRAVRVLRSRWEPEAAARGAAIGAFDAVVGQGLLVSNTERPTGKPLVSRSVGE